MGKIKISKQTEPTTPDTGEVVIYVDSADGKAKFKDEAGDVTPLASESVVDSKISAIPAVIGFSSGERLTTLTGYSVSVSSATTATSSNLLTTKNIILQYNYDLNNNGSMGAVSYFTIEISENGSTGRVTLVNHSLVYRTSDNEYGTNTVYIPSGYYVRCIAGATSSGITSSGAFIGKINLT